VVTGVRVEAGAEPLDAAGELIRSLVHEVGNLLAAVRLSGHFLGGELAGNERRRLSRDVEMLASLCGACLSQIRPLLGEGGQRRFRVPPAALLEGLAQAFEELMPARARLRIAPARGLPEVAIDADAVRNLLVLLVAGAVSAAGSEPVSVQAESWREGPWVVVALSDNGPPVDPLPTWARPGRRGRELGFSVADRVLRLGGGGLRLHAKPGENRVELRLPRAPELPPDARPPVG